MKYTVKIQERPGAMIRPICVEAETPVAAITAACDDYLHPIGTAMPTEVFPGHDGWYAYGEAVWRGEIDWHPGYAAQCCTRELATRARRRPGTIQAGLFIATGQRRA